MGLAARTTLPDGRVDIKSLDLDGVSALLGRRDPRGHRARAVYKWLWQRGARTFAEMEGVPREVRDWLDTVAYIPWLTRASRGISEDATRKYVWELSDGSFVESVLIPDEDHPGGRRLTLCVSSQVGCAMACGFCLTGDLGLKRHLSPSEIAGQLLQVQQDLGDDRRVTNVVMMGMGEPLHNLDSLLVALDTMMHTDALGLSHRRITVSTVGLVPRMRELTERSPVNLAVSLNATTEAQRRQVMPITRRWSLEALMECCRTLPIRRAKRITFEYVMMRGFNDTMEDAERLAALMRGVRCKVNLIPYNENPDRDIRRPSDLQVWRFQDHLVNAGLHTSVRRTRGRDISAACGQLGGAEHIARRLAREGASDGAPAAPPAPDPTAAWRAEQLARAARGENRRLDDGGALPDLGAATAAPRASS